ncbi:MAG: ATP synthase subunit I [Candidatus Korobacteraceae bacterium]
MTTPEPKSSLAEAFFDQALPRIRKFLLALAIAGLGTCVLAFRWPVTAGFLVGAVISYVNQVWLERAVDALGERITAGQSRERGGTIVFRALLRYVFIALGAYVIFNVSLAALYGFLGGVCLPIAAVACEVAVEIFVALRRGF